MSEQHDRLVQFLEDGLNLDELLNPPVQLLEPLMIIGDKSKLTIGPGSRIDSFTKIEIGTSTHIGRGVHIASFAHLGIGGGHVEIGDYAAVASGGKLISGSNQVDAASMSAVAPEHLQRRAKSFVRLNNFAVVLTNAVVLPGVTLGFGAVLAAGAVATKDIPAWEIWGGVPAKFIAKRVIK